MKIKSIRLERYKRFVDTEEKFSFVDEDTGKPYDLIVLVGENGCGKSSILQAIAATLGTATQQIPFPDALDWAGFNISGIDANYRGKSEITLDVAFAEDELQATNAYFDEVGIKEVDEQLVFAPVINLLKKQSYLTEKPASQTSVLLKLYFDVNRPSGLESYPYIVDSGKPELNNQFLGRQYAKDLIYNKRQSPEGLLQRVGGIFWYTEHRTFYSIMPTIYDKSERNPNKEINEIRWLFTRWFAEDNRPKVTEFQRVYQKFFPNRQLLRIGQSQLPQASKVYFEEMTSKYIYELEELSGGERALLPIILDFVEREISNSVILIDELELHLHPPLQQALLFNLQNLGKNNQFIITTHSDYVAMMIGAMPSAKLIRVDIDNENN